MTVVPSYYTAFSCIADRCRHSCCVGWEIDIDDVTAARYEAVEGAFGDRLRRAVHRGEDGCFMTLTEDERCPFLNGRGLCDVILTLGDGALCDICRDHPRFRRDYTDRTEWGLGLCCEAVAELLLTWQEPVRLLTDAGESPPPAVDPDDDALLTARDAAIAVAQDRSLPLAAREDALLRRWSVRLPDDGAVWRAWYSPLERLDPAWDDALATLTSAPSHPLSVSDTAFEQLLVYFLYRQLPPSLEDGCFAERVGFAVLSVRMLRRLCAAYGGTVDALAELARLYSAEIEYSDENIPRLLSHIRTR